MIELTGPERFYTPEEREIIEAIEICFNRHIPKFGTTDGRKGMKIGMVNYYSVESRNTVAKAYLNKGWMDVSHHVDHDGVTHFVFIS